MPKYRIVIECPDVGGAATTELRMYGQPLPFGDQWEAHWPLSNGTANFRCWDPTYGASQPDQIVVDSYVSPYQSGSGAQPGMPPIDTAACALMYSFAMCLVIGSYLIALPFGSMIALLKRSLWNR